MNRLIKNELTKVFHKKAIYIVLFITLVFMILSLIISKLITGVVEYFEMENADFYRAQLQFVDKDDPEQKEEYNFLLNMIDLCELSEKYEKDSWQAYILSERGEEIVSNLRATEGTEEYSKAKGNYDNFIKRLDENDWKVFAKEDLENINITIQESEKMGIDTYSNKLSKQVLEWRLEKEIPFGFDNMNTILESWTNNKYQIFDLEQQEKIKPFTYQDKFQKRELEVEIALAEDVIKNGIKDDFNILYVNNQFEITTQANADLLRVFDNYALFIIIAVVIIAGTIVSQEFSRGTIKLLLVRPYKRWKILLSKLITCFIVLGVVFVAVAVMQFIVTGINYGFTDYSMNNLVYNYNTNSVQNINIFVQLLLIAITKAPMFILMMTLGFSLSAVLNNSPVAITLPLVGMMGTEIINQIAYNFEKAKFLMFFVTPNWDLSIYLFGKMPQFKPISLPFSIVVCVVYFVIMLIGSLVVFNKRNIKNV